MTTEKIIPASQAGRAIKYDFSGLNEYGDCIDYPRENYQAVRTSAYRYGMKHGLKMVTRLIDNRIFVYNGGKVDA